MWKSSADDVKQPAKQMVRAQLGDAPPKQIPKAILKQIQGEYAALNAGRKAKKLELLKVPTTWPELHFSVVYAQGMLIPIEPQTSCI